MGPVDPRDRPEPSEAFKEQQAWQSFAYRETAIAIAVELDRRGSLHQAINTLSLVDFERLAYAAVARYADLHEKRRQEMNEADRLPIDFLGA